MMETTDLWNGFHLAHRRRLYPARLGRVLLKRQMSPARMIVVDVSEVPISTNEGFDYKHLYFIALHDFQVASF